MMSFSYCTSSDTIIKQSFGYKKIWLYSFPPVSTVQLIINDDIADDTKKQAQSGPGLNRWLNG